MYQPRVIEDLATIHARELMSRYGLSDWAIAWHDQGAMAGRCHFASQTITLNRRILLDTSACNIDETIRHEIAHALVAPNDSHDQEWFDKLIEVGGTGIWVFNDGRVALARPTPIHST